MALFSTSPSNLNAIPAHLASPAKPEFRRNANLTMFATKLWRVFSPMANFAQVARSQKTLLKDSALTKIALHAQLNSFAKLAEL